MSGFQITDLGTGRQQTRRQANIRAGQFTSAPIVGGQNIRGSDSPYRVNTVDPLASILGATASAAQGFFESRDTIKKAFENDANKKIDELLDAREQNRLSGMTEADVNAQFETDVRNLYRSGKINSNLDAAKRLNQAYVEAKGKVDADVANDLLDDLVAKRATISADLEGRKREVELLMQATEGQRVGELLEPKLKELLAQDNLVISQKEMGKDLAAVSQTFQNRRTKAYPSIVSLMDRMSREDPPIIWDDPEAQERLAEMYVNEFYYDSIPVDMDSEYRTFLIQNAVEQVLPQVQKDLQLINARVAADRQAEQEQDSVTTLGHILLGGETADRYEQRGGVLDAEFARAAQLTYNATDRPESRPEYNMEYWKTTVLPITANSADPVRAVEKALRMIPEDYDRAVSFGWAFAPDPEKTDEENEADWRRARASLIIEARTAATEQVEPTLTANITAASLSGNPMEGFDRISTALAKISGEEEPTGIAFADAGWGFEGGGPLDTTSSAHMRIWTALQKAKIAHASDLAELSAGTFISTAIGANSVGAATAGQSGNVAPSPEKQGNDPWFRRIGAAIGKKDFGSLREIISENTITTGDGTHVSPAVMPMLRFLEAVENAGDDVNDTRLEAAAAGAIITGYAYGPGRDAVNAEDKFPVPAFVSSRLLDIKERHGDSTAPIFNEEDRLYVATLYQSTPEAAREHLFGTEFAKVARVTALDLQTHGGWDENNETMSFPGLVAAPIQNQETRRAGALIIGANPERFGGGVGNLAEIVAKGFSSPLSMAGDVSSGDITDMTVASAVIDQRDEAMKILRSDFGVSSDDINFTAALAPFQAEIQGRLELEMYHLVGSNPALLESDDGLQEFGKIVAQKYAALVSEVVGQRAYVSGSLIPDPSGTITSLMKKAETTDGNEAIDYFMDVRAQDIALKRGFDIARYKSDEYASPLEQTFYEMLPTFNERPAGYEGEWNRPSWDDVTAEARRLAGVKENEELTLGNIVLGYYQAFKDEEGNPLTPVRPVQIALEEGKILPILNQQSKAVGVKFTFPNLAPGVSGSEGFHGSIEFVAPTSLTSGNAIVIPEAYDQKAAQTKAAASSSLASAIPEGVDITISRNDEERLNEIYTLAEYYKNNPLPPERSKASARIQRLYTYLKDRGYDLRSDPIAMGFWYELRPDLRPKPKED